LFTPTGATLVLNFNPSQRSIELGGDDHRSELEQWQPVSRDADFRAALFQRWSDLRDFRKQPDHQPVRIRGVL